MKKEPFYSEDTINSTQKGSSLQFLFVYLLGLILLMCLGSYAATKTSVASGNWENSAIWIPSGAPQQNDNVVIGSNTEVTTTQNIFIQSLSISPSSKLTLGAMKRVTLNNNLTIDGKLDMNKGLITQNLTGSIFKIGSTGTFTWDPGINSSAEASLFINGIEQFDIGSSLIIKNWYDYTTPLTQFINGNFGNLELNSQGGTNSIVEWDQHNQLELHKIFGTLTIDQGWITLDKSGSITNTTIGNIILKNINATFYAHNGNHPSNFTLHCSNITNEGGTFYGLNDGNGNIRIHTTGNFINSGNVKIINNTGIINVGNGNATFDVDGTYKQITGDTRIIYNIATKNSGVFTSTIGNLFLDGGIFMGQTACHVNNQICTIGITNDLKINFSKNTDKFRCTSISSIGGVLNNARVELTVGENFSINGVLASEVTSSASSGIEKISVNGNLEVNGCTTNFNYGSLSASHNNQLIVGKDLLMSGGQFSISRNNGNLIASINRTLRIFGGVMMIKNNEGNAALEVQRKFEQVSGTLLFHSNTTTISAGNISLAINGSFSQSGGRINLDDNSNSSIGIRELNLRTDSVSFSGTGIIDRNGTMTNNTNTKIIYGNNGKIIFKREGNSHSIANVIQIVGPGTTLSIADCPFQIASSIDPLQNTLIISGTGNLQINQGQIVSNGQQAYSKIFVDSSSTLDIKRADGLFNNNNQASISSIGNINLIIHPKGVIEYSGNINQSITSLSNIGSYTSKKYGILKIALQGAGNLMATAITNEIIVQTRIELTSGILSLNNKTITVENGKADGITREKGFIMSESNYPVSSGNIRWQNISEGWHEIPFGVSNGLLIPVFFKPITGIGKEVSVSTRRTTTDNKPYPSLSLNFPGGNYFATDQTIDRWWGFNAPGVTADVKLSYCGSENSLSQSLATDVLNIIQWKGNGWNISSGEAMGSNSLIGQISIAATPLYPDWTIASVKVAAIDINADLKSDTVTVNWHIKSETGIDHFIVEKSLDGISFSETGMIKASFDSKVRDYNFDDLGFDPNKNIYRLKQVSPDGSFIYSKTVKVSGKIIVDGIKINSTSPNPFTNTLTISLSTQSSQKISISIYSTDGRLRNKSDQISESGESKITLDNLDILEPGTYVLVIESEKGKTTQKIIKN